MALCGTLFSIDDTAARKLRSQTSDAQRLSFLDQLMGDDYRRNDGRCIHELDKSWEWIHRSLTDGRLDWKNGTYPLNSLILGGESLHVKHSYIISLKTPQIVSDAAAKLPYITQEWFFDQFMQIGNSELANSWEEDECTNSWEEMFENTWSHLCGLRSFWLRASREDRHILFMKEV